MILANNKYFKVYIVDGGGFPTNTPFCTLSIDTKDLLNLLLSSSTTLKKEIERSLDIKYYGPFLQIEAMTIRIIHEIHKQLYEALIKKEIYTKDGISILFQVEYVRDGIQPFLNKPIKSYWKGNLES